MTVLKMIGAEGWRTNENMAGGAAWREKMRVLWEMLHRNMRDARVQRQALYPKTWQSHVQRVVPFVWRVAREMASMKRSRSFVDLATGELLPQGTLDLIRAIYAEARVDAAMQAASGKVMAVNATGCLEVFSTPYPETSWQIPWMHSLFGNAPAVAAGVAAALRVKGRTDAKVIAQGGDGGTTDIGFGCLSGMFERNDDVLYICYDNEAYMNTGVQRSSATPPAARTATTMAVGSKPGARSIGPGSTCPGGCCHCREDSTAERSCC